jgi:hypothetical protein
MTKNEGSEQARKKKKIKSLCTVIVSEGNVDIQKSRIAKHKN